MLRSALSSWREYLTPISHSSTFHTSGEITPEEFVAAGDYLVYKFPTWQWSSAPVSKQRAFLPPEKQFLVTRHVPSYARVATYLETGLGDEEEEVDGWTTTHRPQAVVRASATAPVPETLDIEDLIDETAEGSSDDEAAAVMVSADERAYDLHITYSTSYRVPKMYLLGYTAEGTPLTPEQMFEDIASDYRDKTVTIEKAPFLSNTTMVSIHPCQHATVMRVLMARALMALQRKALERLTEGFSELGVQKPMGGAPTPLLDEPGEEAWEAVEGTDTPGIRADQYLVIFLKFISSVTPGIEHDYTMAAF